MYITKNGFKCHPSIMSEEIQEHSFLRIRDTSMLSKASRTQATKVYLLGSSKARHSIQLNALIYGMNTLAGRFITFLAMEAIFRWK